MVCRSHRARRRRLDRRSGYGAGYGCEWLAIRGSRQWVCRQARGRTLELGVGTGLNLRWYPGNVELVAVDLDRERLDVSAERAHGLGRAVRLAVAERHGRPATLGERAGFTVVERQRLWAGYFERVRLLKSQSPRSADV